MPDLGHHGDMTPDYDPAAEVTEICRDLIRIDTTNFGDQPGPGERKAAEHVATLLDEVGIESELWEAEPGRTNVLARWGGTQGDPVLVHGHLDVVPADADDWQLHPFSGEIHDGQLWGRGAVDMKDFDAMLLSSVRARARAGVVPDRPLVLCFTADEEAGGHKGAGRLVEEKREWFEDCTYAVGEVGGFSTTVRGKRLYLIEAAEKGMAWMRLTATGNAGHGSMVHPDNAVTTLAEAVARIGRHEWPVQLTPTMQVLLGAVGRARRHRGDARQRRGADRGVRLRRADARRGHPAHHEPDHARRGLQGERRARPGHRPARRPVPAGARGRLPRRRCASWPGPGSRSSSSPRCAASRRRTTGRWPTR